MTVAMGEALDDAPPKCGMDLLPEGTRFGMLRHMIKSPMMLTVMAAVMVAIMAAAMMMMR